MFDPGASDMEPGGGTHAPVRCMSTVNTAMSGPTDYTVLLT